MLMKRALPITLDDRNRLVLSRSAIERLSKGPLKISSSSRSAAYFDGTELPERVSLDGTWRLTSKHDLEFSIHATSVWFPGMTLTFKTGLVSAGGNELVLSARINDGQGGILGCAFAFSGKWQADKNNRLTFSVTRYEGRSDRLVFEGAWEVGKKNELFYTYEREALKRKDKEIFSFGLKGRWDLGPKRIAYLVEGSGDSVLTFSAALETPGITAKDGEIRYQVGIRFSADGEEKKVLKSVAIYGAWKLGRDLKVGFEAESTAKGKNVLTFTAEKLIFERGALTLGLKTEDGRKFGAEVTFTEAIAKDVELFASLLCSSTERSIFGGVRGKF